MSRLDDLRQGETPFDGFLYADLGQDTDGNTVSVLSALARLGVDPWTEADELSRLSHARARDRLGSLLARLRDIPSLGETAATTVQRLIELLPNAPRPKMVGGAALPARLKSLRFGQIFAIMIVVLFLLQTFFLGSDGSGN